MPFTVGVQELQEGVPAPPVGRPALTKEQAAALARQGNFPVPGSSTPEPSASASPDALSVPGVAIGIGLGLLAILALSLGGD